MLTSQHSSLASGCRADPQRFSLPSQDVALFQESSQKQTPEVRLSLPPASTQIPVPPAHFSSPVLTPSPQKKDKGPITDLPTLQSGPMEIDTINELGNIETVLQGVSLFISRTLVHKRAELHDLGWHSFS